MSTLQPPLHLELYPVITRVIWSEKLSPTLCQLLADKVAAMVAEEKSNGFPLIESESPQYIIKRSWVDTNAANEWIAFVESLNGPLVSITIVT